ncbi:transposase [Pseudomonas sp. IT-93MI4]
MRLEEPLTLTLPKRRTARRERGLIEVFVRGVPTWDSEPNSGLEKRRDRLPFPSPPWGRGLG